MINIYEEKVMKNQSTENEELQEQKYYNTLEIYAVERRLEPFANMIAELEEEQLDKFLGMF